MEKARNNKKLTKLVLGADAYFLRLLAGDEVYMFVFFMFLLLLMRQS